MKEIRCEWCTSTMHKIADHGSGFFRDCADTYLCDNVICGHEREVIRAKRIKVLFRPITQRG